MVNWCLCNPCFFLLSKSGEICFITVHLTAWPERLAQFNSTIANRFDYYYGPMRQSAHSNCLSSRSLIIVFTRTSDFIVASAHRTSTVASLQRDCADHWETIIALLLLQ